MPTRNINLTEHFDRFVNKQVRTGRFQNASEVLRAGLHLLEQQTEEQQQKLAVLRAMAAEGFTQLDQGLGIEIESKEHLTKLIGEIGRRATKVVKHRANIG